MVVRYKAADELQRELDDIKREIHAIRDGYTEIGKVVDGYDLQKVAPSVLSKRLAEHLEDLRKLAQRDENVTLRQERIEREIEKSRRFHAAWGPPPSLH
jgi:hypothetical protein